MGGFDLVSDESHYGLFVCQLCQSLASLDAVVLPCQTHVFCRQCLTDFIKKQIDNQKPCVCPTCDMDITAGGDDGELSSAVPNGNSSSSGTLQLGSVSLMVRPLGEAQPLAMQVLQMVQVACKDNGEHEKSSKECDWSGDYGEWLRHHREAHGGEDHKHENGGPTMSNGSKKDHHHQQTHHEEQYARSLSQPSLFRNQSKGSVGGGMMSMSNKSDQDHEININGEMKDASEDSLYKHPRNGSDPPGGESQMMDMGIMSIGDIDWNVNNASPKRTTSKALGLEHPDDEVGRSEEEGGAETAAEAIERSEKLKKQANAKFNKGDFEGARSLYTDGLDVITGIINIGHAECELVATLFSNRAVTFFREKDFDKCIDDCDKALEYEPTYEKSYIRKWRALMALGDFEAACECLEQAHREIPSSQRVKQELTKAREQKEVLMLVNTMIDGGNLEKAKETIKPLAKESDNIGLLLVAAMADAGLGLTESALDKVNKALRFNPNHVEALQLRGLVLFLSGEMEKGIRLIQELHNKNPGNAEIQLKLEQCETTLTAFSKGRGYAKRGRYKEAVEQFTEAMDERALPLPTGTALYCLIKMERSEALLLSKHYAEALRDCKDALDSEPENAEAWALKAEIYMCLGRAAEAKQELAELRQTWASDNMVIDEAYRKANFEMKVRKVDDELMQLINEVESGVPEKIIIDGRENTREQQKSGMHQSERRYGSSDRRSQMDKKAKSYRISKSSGSSERHLKTEKIRKSDKTDKRSRRDRDRVRSTASMADGSTRTHESSRTMNTNATGVSSRTLGTRGEKKSGASHRAKRSGARRKSSRNLMAEKEKS